jgi:hypothetical protein
VKIIGHNDQQNPNWRANWNPQANRGGKGGKGGGGGGQPDHADGCPSFIGQMEIVQPTIDKGINRDPRLCASDESADGFFCCVRMVGVVCETNREPSADGGSCRFTTTNEYVQLAYDNAGPADIPFLSTIYSADDVEFFGDLDGFSNMFNVVPSGVATKGLNLLGGGAVFRQLFEADDWVFGDAQGCVFNGEATFIQGTPRADPFAGFDEADRYDGDSYYYGGGERRSVESEESMGSSLRQVKSLFDVDLKEWRQKKNVQRAELEAKRNQRRQLRRLRREAAQ